MKDPPKKPDVPREMMTANFARAEFACPCCSAAPVTQTLASALQGVRDIVHVPVHINSGYRCPEHNKAVGGAPASEHVQGIAADISAECGWRALYAAALRVPAFTEGGVGVYPDSGAGFIHVDVRKKRARWARINGRYTSIEEALA